LYQALTTIYPEREWPAWKFKKIRTHNDKERLEQIGQQLGVKTLEDWAYVSYKRIQIIYI
jgi:hypothetical protein